MLKATLHGLFDPRLPPLFECQDKSLFCEKLSNYSHILEMGQNQSGGGGGQEKKDDNKEKKPKYEPPVPSRVGKKKKIQKGPDAAHKLPSITPHTKCKLR